MPPFFMAHLATLGGVGTKKATETVVAQAELLGEDWAGEGGKDV